MSRPSPSGPRFNIRANRKFLSDFFILKIKASRHFKKDRCHAFNLTIAQLDGWLSGANRAPIDHEGLQRLARVVECPVEKMFV